MRGYSVALDSNINIPADRVDPHIQVASDKPPQGGVLTGNELSRELFLKNYIHRRHTCTHTGIRAGISTANTFNANGIISSNGEAQKHLQGAGD